jgi:hypothetical protein
VEGEDRARGKYTDQSQSRRVVRTIARRGNESNGANRGRAWMVSESGAVWWDGRGEGAVVGVLDVSECHGIGGVPRR